MKELSEEVKAKLQEVVSLWADDNLYGKPALLATALYFNLERAFKEQAEKIDKMFSEEARP